jgi:proteasome lid subunit RPN8/RPN11
MFDAQALHADIARHAAAEFPRECCGLVVQRPGGDGVAYIACTNAATDPADAFVLDPRDYAAAADEGTVLAIVHSHPNASAHPSMADRVMCERSGLPWLIMGWPSGVMTRTEPVGWRAPLVGREFHHGVLDCYTLIQDYYAQQLGLQLPDFQRADGWWEQGGNLYRDNFAAAGFHLVDGPPREHDVLLMRVAARVDNHAGVFTSGCILHHLYGRLSVRDVWGDVWQRHTTGVLRHQACGD